MDDGDGDGENDHATSRQCAEEKVVDAAAETLVLYLPMER